MITGPIFRVELVSAARRRRYFGLRVVYSAIILFVLWVTYENVTAYNSFSSGGAASSISATANAAAAFFWSFSWVQLIGILLVAPAMAVGTIATERERRTIEYLFATDLSNLEIVLGKTAARLLLIGQLVLASLPILFIFRLLGGIPADLLAASFTIAASTALFVTSISVCVSVWSPRARDAAMRVYRALAVLLIGPPIVLPLLTMGAPNNWWAQQAATALGFLWDVNPLTVLFQSMRSSVAVGAGFDFQPVLRMVAWHVGISIALIALATWAVRRVHLRDSGRGAVSKPKNPQRRRWFWHWRPSLGNHAMLWKEAFAPTAKTKLGLVGMAANVIVVIAALVWTLYVFFQTAGGNQFWDPEDYFIYTAFFTGVIGSGLLLLLAARASSLFTLEKERDTWTSLLSTPLTGKDIVFGKLLGNLYSARWGFFLMVFTWGLGVLFSASFLIVIPILAGTFVLCATFVTSVGMAYSLRSATSLRAMGLTLMTVVFVGGGYMMCCCPIAAIVAHSADFGSDFGQIGLAPCLTFLVVAPAAFYAEGINSSSVQNELLGAYVAGVVLYLVVNGVLVTWLVQTFDAAAGRTADMPDVHNPSPLGRMLGEGQA